MADRKIIPCVLLEPVACSACGGKLVYLEGSLKTRRSGMFVKYKHASALFAAGCDYGEKTFEFAATITRRARVI